MPINVDELSVDLLSVSAHKLSGPKGVGALYVRDGTKITSFLHGGEQEHALRASTENVTGIVGLGKAAEIARGELTAEPKRIGKLRDRLIKELFGRIEHVCLNGHPKLRLPNNINVSIDFVEGPSVASHLDMVGVAVSTASACQTGHKGPSHVLTAMGYAEEEARNSIRFSLGRESTPDDIDYVLEVLPPIIKKLRKASHK